MSKRVLILGKDPLGKAKYANVTESGDLRVQLSGNIEEHLWLHSDPPPTPISTRALGVRVEPDNSLTVLYWDGSAWNEVI